MKLRIDPRVLHLKPSATVTMNELSNKLMAEGRMIYKFGLGQCPFPPFPGMIAALREHAHQRDYQAVRGLDLLRERIAEYDGAGSGASSVLVGPGSKELMFGLTLALDADLLLPQASWVSYAPQSAIVGRPVHWLPTRQSDSWRLQPSDLEAFFDTAPSRRLRVLVLNSPCNPTGAAYPDALLSSIAAVCRARGVIVLSDEIYGDLHHRRAHVSIARHYPEGTIISNGISKWAGAGGWRLGWFRFPPELRDVQEAMATIASETFTSTSAPIQYAAVEALRRGKDELRRLDAQAAVLGAVGRTIARILQREGVQMAEPEGAFYLFLDVSSFGEALRKRGLRTSADMTARLLREAGVAVLPGSEFGRDPTEFSMRLSYVNFDGEAALRAAFEGGVNDDLEFAERYAPRTIEGVRKLIAWLHNSSAMS